MPHMRALTPEGSRANASGDPVGELLVACGRGDEAAFEHLFDAVAGGVLGLVRRVVRDPAQSEEVTQEVMVEVWRHAPRFDPARGLATTWILTIAHRRAVDRVRSVIASAQRDANYALASHQPHHDDVPDQVEARLDQRRVRNALAELTPIQRSAIELAYYKGYTHVQVAEVLAIPLGTAKTRIRDALIHLRDVLEVTS